MSSGDHPARPEPGAPVSEPQGEVSYTYGYGDRAAAGTRTGSRWPMVAGAVAGVAALAALGVWLGLTFFGTEDAAAGADPLAPVPTIAAPSASATPDATPEPTATVGEASPSASAGPDEIGAADMEPGTCFLDPYATAEKSPDGSYVISGYEVVPCDQPHYGEVFLQTSSTATSFDADALVIESQETCYRSFEGYVGASYQDSVLYIDTYTPTAETWADGDRAITCAATDPDGQITGSVAGWGK